MNRITRRFILITATLLASGMAASSAQAQSPVIGGLLGGGAGAMVGNSFGGRDGAIIGGALGAAAGVVIASDYREPPRRYAPQPVYYYSQPAVVYAAPPVYYQRYEGDWGRHHRHGHDNGRHNGYDRGWDSGRHH
jgi:hypothetical protein